MRYKLLGRSGLRVSELALGTMTFGDDWGWGAPDDESKKMFDLYAEAGGNFIDTANRYTEGTSEKLVGEFIREDRDHFVLATKYTLKDRDGDPNFSGNHRKNMTRSVETSLHRLRTNYIDLLWVHAWDFTTPIDEVLRGLDDLISAGMVHYIGVSDTPAWIISRANMLAELRGWSQFVGLQLQYSLVERTPERELLPMARYLDLGVTAWGALGSGVLTGKYNSENANDGRAAGSDKINQRNLKITDKVIQIAKDLDCEPSQVAISWVRQQPGVMIPILGARTDKQLQANLETLNISLSENQLSELNEISAIEMGFPHDFLESDVIKDIVYGGMKDVIDNHHLPPK